MSQQHSRLAPTEDFATPDQDPSEPPESNCPLYGSLNSRHPSFFIKCSDNVLKTMAASAPSHLKECLTSSANRDTIINQILLLRHEEAVEFYICTKTAHYWLQKLLLMDVKLLRSMASFNPSWLRAMMKSALMADLTIQQFLLGKWILVVLGKQRLLLWTSDNSFTSKVPFWQVLSELNCWIVYTRKSYLCSDLSFACSSSSIKTCVYKYLTLRAIPYWCVSTSA